MPNFTPLPAYPYGFKAPFPHGDANDASEKITKAINGDEGSSHAPTGDLAFSGSMGHGFVFADAFPFTGEIDTTGTLTFTSSSSGPVIFGTLVPVRVYGLLTIKTPVGAVTCETGTITTWQNGATATLASGATMNLNGAVALRGQFTVTASGGPGSLVIQNGTTNTCAGLFFFLNNGEARFQAGSFITGAVHVTSGTVVLDSGVPVSIGGTLAVGDAATFNDDVTLNGDTTFAGGKVPLLAPDRAWTRWANIIAGSELDLSVDTIILPAWNVSTGKPVFRLQAGAASALKCVLEFVPPDGATAVEVTVTSKGGSVGGDLDSVPEYKVVRWKLGSSGSLESMSSPTTDGHDGTAANWTTIVNTTVTINAHATIDLAYRYGVLITAPVQGGASVACDIDIKVEGTTDRITGK